jgi:glucokinase
MLIGSMDIGGTKTIVAVTDDTGLIHAKRTFPTDVADHGRHFMRCAEVLHELLAQMNVDIRSLLGVGINVPGMVDYKNGMLLNAPFAAWRNLPVRDHFRHLLKTPDVFVDNDVKSCALGEKHFGYRDRYMSYVWVTLSTGVGAAVVIDGRIWRGPDNLAGELGHIKVEYHKPRRCSCGKSGCLEAYASGTGITASVLEAERNDHSFGNRLNARQLPHDAAGCAELAESGDEIALSVYRVTADYLARGLSAAINLLNPQAIILGGGVARSLHLLTPQIRSRLHEYVVDQLVDTEIIPTLLGYEAALLGTAALVLEGK